MASKEGFGKGKGKQKVRRHTTNKRPRELLFMRSINGEEAKTEDKVGICQIYRLQ